MVFRLRPALACADSKGNSVVVLDFTSFFDFLELSSDFAGQKLSQVNSGPERASLIEGRLRL